MSQWVADIVSQLSSLGPWGPVIFVLLYVVASLAMAPAFILTFAAGAVWGLWWGSLYVYLGAFFGASAVHLLAGPFLRSRVTRWLDREPPGLDAARERLRIIVQDGQRAGAVIGRVRELLRKTDSVTAHLDLNELIRDSVAHMRGLIIA